MNQIFASVSQRTQQISSALSEQRLASREVAEGVQRIASNSSQGVRDIENIADAIDRVEALVVQQTVKLAEFDLEGKVVKLAQSDHVIWKKRLASMISGRAGLKVEELADHHSCRLGKWYDALENPSYTTHNAYKELIKPHESVHSHGIKAVEKYNNGDFQGALAEIDQVEKASKEVLRLLVELESVSGHKSN